MKVISVKNYEELSLTAARMIGAQVLLKPNCVLGLATGSSPIGTYANLVADYESGLLDFAQVKTVNLDEYYGLNPENDQSYRYFMNYYLFDKVNIDKKNTHVPQGNAPCIATESQRYEALIDSLGGVDLQLLGIGLNGHIGFNEPDQHFPNTVHGADLTESTIAANARLFAKKEDVPTKAITMGIGTIMRAKKIVLIAGADKKDIIDKVVNGPVTPNLPASILQLHADVTIIAVKTI